MSQLSRRSAMLAVPATTATLVAAGAPNAAADPETGRKIVTFRTRRIRATLANVPVDVPALGTTFISYLELLNDGGERIGDGSVRGSIVDIIPGVTPRLVTQTSAVFRFEEGEIHTSSMHVRQIPNPGVRHLSAITGGTGDYRTARGSGSFEYATGTESSVVLNVMVDPP